jgi:hypothetical protein
MKIPSSVSEAGTLGVLAFLLAGSPAWAVTLTLDNSVHGVAGQTVLVNLNTTSLTGLNVRSFQFDVTYSASVVTATAVVESTTMVSAAGWGDATFSVTPGHLIVSHAGANALSGAGPLCALRFVINPALLGGSATGINFGSFTFNEGAPNDTTVNGFITVNATPVISVSPNSGEIIRGQTLGFSVSGSVTNPVAWSTTNPSVATITGAGVLTGVAPGSVRVVAVDAASHRDTSDDVVLVRGMGITAGTVSTPIGQSFSLPVTVTSLTGLGIRSGQFTITYNGAVFSVTGVSVPVGSPIYNHGPVGFSSQPGTCTVDFATTTDVSGSGTLFNLQCQATAAGGSGVAFSSALFNETLIAKPTSGSVSVNSLPTLTISPDAVTLLAGQTQNFTLFGSAVLPITWRTLDSTVATIDGTGKLTAVAGGVTQVRATDAIGNFDLSGSITVYDCKVSVAAGAGPPGSTVRVELRSDRDLAPLGIYSAQYSLIAGSALVTQMTPLPSGLIGGWSRANLASSNPGGTTLTVAAAGATPLGTGTVLQAVDVTISPSATLGSVIPLTLSNLICNEGHPSPQLANGSIQVLGTSDVGAGSDLAFGLATPEPNPASGPSIIRFVLPRISGDSRVVLAVHGLDGRRVRTLVDAPWPAGAHEVRWDGHADSGGNVPPGVYFLRLDWSGQRLTRRLVRVR